MYECNLHVYFRRFDYGNSGKTNNSHLMSHLCGMWLLHRFGAPRILHFRVYRTRASFQVFDRSTKLIAGQNKILIRQIYFTDCQIDKTNDKNVNIEVRV